MPATDRNDSLATISGVHYIEPTLTPSMNLGASESTRFQKEKGGPHGPWTRTLLPSTNQTREETDYSEEPTVFSDKKGSSEPIAQLSVTHEGPTSKDYALNQLQRKPGHVPISTVFHEESYRIRADDTDDEDLDFIANRKRKKVALDNKHQRGKSILYDAIIWDKGEFGFPYRTFRPKVQVATDAPPGVTPQGIIAERRHRIYRRIDLHATLEKLGVEYADLLPPPNYGEQNPRFLQESMWRNRSRISGIEKRTYIYGQDEAWKDARDEKHHGGRSSRSSSSESVSSLGSSFVDSASTASVAEVKVAHLETGSQFGFYFPLEYFDNEDFDIRSAEDWMSLRAGSGGQGKYPLPGKAYLPMPLDSPEQMLSLAEITSEVLLDKSLRLQAFRKWLIKQRHVRCPFLPDAKGSIDDLEESHLMEMGTTIKTLLKRSDATVKASTLRDLGRQFSSAIPSDAVMHPQPSEIPGESDIGSLSGLLSFDHISEDFLSQFSKMHVKTGDGDTLLVKRSESILSDVWSEPNSLAYLLGPKEELLGEVTKEEDLIEQFAKFKASMMLNFVSKQSDQHTAVEGGGLGSPDVDPYEQNGPNFDLVYDYNKMKTVHNYNWKWIDVAIFEYDFSKQRYLVRSIFEPHIFAWVPKVYLCMDAEDPSVHADRIKDAVERRANFENRLRYNVYVDCLSVEGAPSIPDGLMANAVGRVLSTPRLVKHEKEFNMAKKEVNLDYARAHMNFLFDNITDAHPRYYKTWVYDQDYYRVHSEPGADWLQFRGLLKECRTGVFAFKKYRLEQRSVIFTKEPCAAFSEILVASVEARARHLILTRQEAPIPLNLYMERQLEQMGETRNYMTTEWLNFVVNTIIRQLDKVVHSWYNMEEEDWGVFEVSKISKYLKLVKFLMQDTLRYMVLDSVKAYLDEIRQLTETVSNPDKRGLGVTESGISDEKLHPTPIWTLDLILTPVGPTYNHYLRDFPVELLKIIHICVDSVAGIPDILPMIMRNLLHGTKKPLFPVAKTEPVIIAFVEELKEIMKRALVPVDVYAQSYKYYMPVYHLDLDKFMEEWNSSEHNSKEIRVTVEFHIRHYAEIESEIPNEIDIGAFRINIGPLRTELLERKKQLYMAILDSFASKLRKLIRGILDEYEEIETKLSNRSNDIEEVMELKHYLAGLPTLISRNDELIQLAMKDYELFERFKYRIPNEDFEAKWRAMMGLRKMYQLAEEAVAWLGSDYKRLLNSQKADLVSFSVSAGKTIDSLQSLSEFVDVTQFPEVKEKLKEVDKVVKALEEEGELVNRRQTHFGLPPVQTHVLAKIVQEMHRYKSLWLTIGDWMEFKEDAYSLPLEALDMRVISQVIIDGLKVMRKSLIFYGKQKKVKIQQLAKKVKREMDAFRKLVPLVKTFTNPGLRPRHLEAISEICGFEVTEGGVHTLEDLIARGVGHHVEKIVGIGDTAGHELNIELELNSLEETGHEIVATLSKDPKNGIESVILPEGTDNFMEKAIRVVEEFQQSPYRAPFASRLDLLEKRLRAASEALKEIRTAGPDWVQLQPSFEAKDAPAKMPLEFKIFSKMNRIWRRIIRIIRVTSGVLDFAADRTLRAGIAQFEELNAKVRELLEERNKPKDSDSDDD